MQSVYEAAGGQAGLLRLAEAWHARVMEDGVVSHAFSHGFHPQHSERLAAYWAEALGGPASYSAACGDETSVVRIHSGNGPHEETTVMAAYHESADDVPEGLTIPRWSWDGLQS
jgi:hemoglobin